MQIQDLIDRDYCSVSVLEDMQQMAVWLQERAYYAIIDEELRVAGIVTARDFVCHPHRQVIDCNFIKPSVRLSDSAADILNQMLLSRNEYLPVYDDFDFIGVISIWSLAQCLVENT